MVTAVFWSLEIISTVIFIISEKKTTWKTLGVKMIASSAFLLYALYLTFQTGLDSLYGKCIILSQALAWVGDFFMTYSPIKNNNQLVYGIVGGLAFLFAHGVYLYSFFLIQKRIDLFPKGLFWIIFAITILLVSFIMLSLKISFGKLTLLVAIYVSALSLMCSGALYTAISCRLPSVFLTLGVGSILFVVSDFTLGVKIFGGKRFDIFPVRIVYISAYYIAQMLIATSIVYLA